MYVWYYQVQVCSNCIFADGQTLMTRSRAITISNMLWAVGCVSRCPVDYDGAFWPVAVSSPHLTVLGVSRKPGPCQIPAGLSRYDSGGLSDDRPAQILEIGAGLSAGGLGVALLARHLQKSAQIRITDCDPLAVDVIESTISCNALTSAACAHRNSLAFPMAQSESTGHGREGSFDGLSVVQASWTGTRLKASSNAAEP